jgi:hypothetical protein
MTRAISSPMTETVIDDADSVSADGGEALGPRNFRKCAATYLFCGVADQLGSNWALGNHCFHGVYEAFPLNSEASKRYCWGTVGRLDLIEETEGR